MKIPKPLIAALLFTTATVAFSPAHAKTTAHTATTTNDVSSFLSGLSNIFGGFFNSGGATYPIPSAGIRPGGTSLPVNNNVWVLVVAAGAVGLKTITSKEAQLATAKL